MFKHIVSVFILTYNQEQFIAQTLDSILSQKTNFLFQLVIGEDCSTDTTRNICETYAQQFSEKIKLLPALEKNIGLIANYMRTIKECDGKYIAICDGDDYWIDDLKLQKQVNFLDSNPDFSIVYTKVRKLFPNSEFKESFMNYPREESDFSDLIKDNFIPSVTVLFKNIQDSQNQLPVWISNFPYGDWPTYLWTIKNGGKICFLDEVTAVYRMDIGVSTSITKVNSKLINVNLGILYQILNDFSFNYRKKLVQKEILQKKISLMLSFNRENLYFKALKQLVLNLIENNNKFIVLKLYIYSIYKKIMC
jgi:glycosyltransferase involved in cell wall biosynthesis